MIEPAERTALLGGIVKAIREWVQAALARHDERIQALEQQQSKSIADAYQGVHLTGKSYVRGQLVTHAGSLWLALLSTSATPGSDGTWKMIVKAGRDGKDAAT